MIDLNPNQLETVTRILAGHVPECEVRAFGSRVTWTAKDYSDLDLVVVGERALDLDALSRLKEAFEESDLPFRVDVLDWHVIGPAFQKVIEKKYEVVQKSKKKSLDMVGEWRKVVISDIADLSGGFAFKSEDYTPAGRFILRTLNIRDDCSISRDDAVYLPEHLWPLYARFELQPSDTLFVMVGATLGKVGFVREKDLPAFLNQNMWLIRTKRVSADARFVHYAFRHAVKASLGWASGSARDFVRRDDYRNLQLSIPQLSEQRAIAHILGTLDDKIELNRRMNETLEEMARALFKSWFVDFDPVRAKAEGRDPSLPKPLADLFPDCIEDSELGEIPQGWGVAKLADLAMLNPESWSKVSRPAIIQYVDLSNTKWGHIESVTTYARDDAPSRAQRVLRVGDTIVGTVRPGNGAYALVADQGLTGSTGFAVLRPQRPEYLEFVYLAATTGENIEVLAHLADGGAYPAVRPEVVASLHVVRAPNAVVAAFSNAASPPLSRMATSERESRTLAALRDTLLPKLVSGELRVKDAERIVEIV